MLNTPRTSAIVATIAVHAIGCSITKPNNDSTNDGGSSADGGATTGSRTVDGGADLGECVPYTPAEISGTKTGTFASADEIVKIALPETDVGGGLLKVTYLADKQPLVGSIWLGEGAKKDVPRRETSAFGPGITDGAASVVYYRLAGKKRYEVGVQPFSFSDSDTNSYTVTYSYEPQLDCYEANDTRDAAKRIPLNQTITASLHTGIGSDDGDLVSSTGEDWYTFELAAEKVVQLKATLPGKDGPDGKNSALFTIFTADGSTAAECGGEGIFDTDPVSSTEAVRTCEGTLAAGKYFVKLAHFVSQYAATDVNVAPDKSWNTPYTFIVDAK